MVEITKEITDSLTLKFSQLARERVAKGEKIISLGLGEPGFDTPEEIKEAAYEAIKAGYTKYSNSFGLMDLREPIAKKLKQENKILTTPNNIIVTPGAKQAFYIALMAILRPYDEIINISPCYVSYVPQIKLAEPTSVIKNVNLRKDGFTIDWESLKKSISEKTKAIVLNFPHNPTGIMITEDEVKQVYELAEEFNFYIISDEIYEKLNFSKKQHFSPGALEKEPNRVITINGFSKAFSMTGWRIGYLTANSKLIKVLSRIQQHINTNTCTFIQKAAAKALSIPTDFIDNYNLKLQKKALFLSQAFDQVDKIHAVQPEGGFFAFANIGKTGLKSDEFSSKLLQEKGVATTPGIAFGKDWDDHIRISLAANDVDFNEGITLIKEFVEEL